MEDLKKAGFIRTSYQPAERFEGEKTKYVQRLGKLLEPFEAFLGSKKWFAGDRLTFVDFFAWEQLYHHSCLAPGCLDKFPNLKGYFERFQQLPKIAEYTKSSKYIARPINQPFAAFS